MRGSLWIVTAVLMLLWALLVLMPLPTPAGATVGIEEEASAVRQSVAVVANRELEIEPTSDGGPDVQWATTA